MSESVLQPLNLRILSDNELRTFVQLTDDEVEKAQGVDPYLQTLAKSAGALLVSHQQALSRTAANSSTKALVDADDKRDLAFRSIRHIISGKILSIDDETRSAATKIEAMIHLRGDKLDSAPYADETAGLTLLIADFDKPENSALIDKIGLRAEVESLRKCEADFVALYSELMNEKEVKGELPLLVEQKQHIYSEVGHLLATIRRESRMTADSTVGGLVGKVSEIIDTIFPAARLRETLAAKKKAPASPAATSSASDAKA